jgi:Gluconate 2-dehydrogenase subunit 3
VKTLTIKRRTMLGLAASLIAVGDSLRAMPAAARGAARKGYLGVAEMALLDTLAEIIIPADEHSPGAHDAGVAADLDMWLGILKTAPDDTKKKPAAFREGLKAIEAMARKAHQKNFVACTPEQRIALVAVLAAAEKQATTVAEKFFVECKRVVAHSYYTSEIGIHQEMAYPGNQVLETYVGYRPDEPLVLPNQRKEAGWHKE